MAKSELSRAEENALVVSYEVMGSRVDLDLDFVKNYLVRGDASKVTNQEVLFFMNTCKMQKLNPLVSGEAYCIKFGNEPAQMVVGKGAYMRRAFENPDYICKEDGIIVLRKGEILAREGCCPYPGEELIGGWCRVHFNRSGKERDAYKEVALAEYNKGMANWKSKPATMINKVAISQCIREAFPKDYEGVYSEEEMVASGAIPPADFVVEKEEDPLISEEQRKALFSTAKNEFGPDTNDVIMSLIGEFGFDNTRSMPTSVYQKVMLRLSELCMAHRQESADMPSEEEASDDKAE